MALDFRPLGGVSNLNIDDIAEQRTSIAFCWKLPLSSKDLPLEYTIPPHPFIASAVSYISVNCKHATIENRISALHSHRIIRSHLITRSNFYKPSNMK
ncbi:hypothetical protein CW304_22690 [Bacillus sp. UFRGS-B20]|nr:hypothetical protein CW304_22690 [Bacillus sp. UFRGS-B20]